MKHETEKTLDEIMMRGNECKYSLLGRLAGDCEYYINQSRSTKYLWAKSIADQIECMKKLYNSFADDEKPTWINLDAIDNYESDMYRTSELEYAALNIYDLCTSYNPSYFYEYYGTFIYGKDYAVTQIIKDIKTDPAAVTKKLREMQKGISPDAPFYQDIETAISMY